MPSLLRFAKLLGCTLPNKACSRPPLAQVGVGKIPCNLVLLQMSRPLNTAAANACPVDLLIAQVKAETLYTGKDSET